MTEVNDGRINEEEMIETSTEEAPETKPQSLYEIFERDEDLEKEGIPIIYGDAGTFLVARAGGSNDIFAKALDKGLRPYRALMDQGKMEDSVALEILITVFVETVLKGWTGVRGRDGKILAYNRENAIQLFKDLPELFADIREQAGKGAHYRKEATDIAAGN